jgi:aspartate/methionine/tyrosine aminotransferase
MNDFKERALKRVTPVVEESDSSPMRDMMKMMETAKDLMSLSAGEARFDAPRELIDAGVRAMQGGKNLYTSTNGIPQIREAVANFVNTQFNTKVNPEENILMTVGGMEAIYLATQILLEKGDKVLLPDPGWGVMRPIMERKGATVAYYPLEEKERWTIDADAIIEMMDETVKLVVINSPSNPTGAMLGKEGFARLIEKAQQMGIFILSDEVYHNYVFEGEHVSTLSFDCLENLVFINSFSKTFAVTGWRLGYAISHPWIIRQMGVFKESISLCSFSIGQWALAEYLESSSDYLDKVRALCRGNMEMMVERLNGIPGVRCTSPQGGLYAFPDFSEIEPSSQALFKRALDGGIAVVPGVFFGSQGEGHVRLMYAAERDLISKALDRLEAVFK